MKTWRIDLVGTPLPPPPPDPGELCTVCWGDSGIIGTVTPRTISVQLFDLEEGDNWQEIYREELFTPTELIQLEFFPCIFKTETPFFIWILEYRIDGTFFQVIERFFPETSAFFHDTLDVCVLSAPNDLIAPFEKVAFNGSMSLYLGAT